MLVRELLKQAEDSLDNENKDVNAAKVLFYHLAKKEPHQLYLMMDEEVDETLKEQFLQGMQDFNSGKPIQYIKSVETFFGRDFKVDEHVLIPRYETEELVENILYRIDEYFIEYPTITLCDVGTGSGAIAISLALEEPRLQVVATDISKEAIVVAKSNAKALDAKVSFDVGDMLQPLIEKNTKVDIFVSNPPYIPQEQDIQSVVKDNEPHVALFGGKDGLYFYRKIIQDVHKVLNERAILAFEMGFDQRKIMEEALQQYFPNDTYEIIKDINGKDRMLFIYHNITKNQYF